jgi:ribosomal protein L7/L12
MLHAEAADKPEEKKMSQPQVLPPEVIEALERGKLIEAIKLLRASKGLGLKAAKDAVEAHARGRARGAAAEAAPPAHAGQQGGVMEALQAGNKIEAIKRMRENTGMGLKEAKEAVDALEGNFSVEQRPGLAPGEVPPSRSNFTWWVLGVAAVLIAWFLLRR